MTKKNEVARKVPELRFPEFRDAQGWKEEFLGAVAVFAKGKGISKSEISLNGSQPCIRYGELYTHYKEVINSVISRTNLPPNNLVLSQANDVIIPASGETQIDIATASCVLKSGIALGSDLNIIRSKMNGIFLSYYLNNVKKKAIAELAQGISVVHLYASQLKTLNIDTPEISEQQKIADCLSSIDDVITAQAKKIETLKAHKKGLMQQLFPAEDETVPHLRFPGFRVVQEWKMQKVSSILRKVSNQVNVDLDEMYRQIGIRSHGKGIFYKELVSGKQLGNKRVFWVEEEAFIINIVFAWEQAVAKTSKAEKGMIASHRFPMYKTKNNKININYVVHFFLTKIGKNLLALASPGGAGRNRTLGQKDFDNLEFLLPEAVEEQIKIADCLSSIDDLIAPNILKLEALRAHKKGLMQGLFPAVDGATA